MSLPWRRRHYLVKTRLQVRFITLLLLQMGFILASLALVVNSHMSLNEQIAASVPLVEGRDRLVLQSELGDVQATFYSRSLLMLAGTTVILIGFGLLASHRLAGPIVKLERYINAVADGDLSQRIAFRRTDHLDEFADSLNDAIECLDQRQLRSRELGIELRATEPTPR